MSIGDMYRKSAEPKRYVSPEGIEMPTGKTAHWPGTLVAGEYWCWSPDVEDKEKGQLAMLCRRGPRQAAELHAEDMDAYFDDDELRTVHVRDALGQVTRWRVRCRKTYEASPMEEM